MAKANADLIVALRKTANKIKKNDSQYQWGHMGSCNCGHLAQEITKYSREEIHNYAMQTRMGDWADQSSEFCPTSNLPMNLVISSMLDAGLALEDFKHLERLDDRKVLALLPVSERNLKQNNRQDAVKYLNTWANYLENELLEKMPSFNLEKDLMPTEVLETV
ncbi:MAG: hypothetical protein EAZ97_03620 [Bacteroidetes bacterium]|nr:MAG: hypothetical protein EAZ97_03620 [Bacteroidota bacterium]